MSVFISEVKSGHRESTFLLILASVISHMEVVRINIGSKWPGWYLNLYNWVFYIPLTEMFCGHVVSFRLKKSASHWCLHIEQPQAQHLPTSTHYYELTSPPEFWDLLVSDASWYHHREAQNHSPEHSRSPFLAGGMNFPPLSGIPVNLQATTENSSLSTLLDFILN